MPTRFDREYYKARRDAMVDKWRYIYGRSAKPKDSYLAALAHCRQMLDEREGVYAMSPGSRAVAAAIDWSEVAARRSANAVVLLSELATASIPTHFSPSVPPLYVPITIEDRDAVQDVLRCRDIYCPYLWPLPPAACEAGGYASEFVDTMLAIPCDQRYDKEDMAHIAQEVIRAAHA